MDDDDDDARHRWLDRTSALVMLGVFVVGAVAMVLALRNLADKTTRATEATEHLRQDIEAQLNETVEGTADGFGSASEVCDGPDPAPVTLAEVRARSTRAGTAAVVRQDLVDASEGAVLYNLRIRDFTALEGFEALRRTDREESRSYRVCVFLPPGDALEGQRVAVFQDEDGTALLLVEVDDDDEITAVRFPERAHEAQLVGRQVSEVVELPAD